MSNPGPSSAQQATKPTRLPPYRYLLTLLAPIALATIWFWLDPFNPAPYPSRDSYPLGTSVFDPTRVKSQLLRRAGVVGLGRVVGPEDIAYDPDSRVMYTGCSDGWVKRVRPGEVESEWVVEDWVNTGGRPLGIAFLRGEGGVVVADADQGLLKITKEKQIELLSKEAEGQRFKSTDGVDIAKNGTIYFTDASYKYSFKDFLYDILEGRPHGRLLSFDFNTQVAKVLLKDLYFANGVAVSPDQSSLIFCETAMKRCRRYYIEGDKSGKVENFIDNLPGFPDNIHYDGLGHYWIAISSALPPYMDRAMRHPLNRKLATVMSRFIGLHHFKKNGGVVAVDLEGNPTHHFYDPKLSDLTTGVRIQDYLYLGSLHYPHIIQFNLSSDNTI